MQKTLTTYYDGCRLRDGTDFFRLFLDDDANHEIGVYSTAQSPADTEITDTKAVYR